MDAYHEAQPAPYEAPTLVRLGTLAELTQGPFSGLEDGVGGFDGVGASL